MANKRAVNKKEPTEPSEPWLTIPEEPEPGARPESTPFGDGRDGAPQLRSGAWVAACAAVLLLLPRQWFAAGLCALIAAGLALAHRRWPASK